jgi:hypothetical protein
MDATSLGSGPGDDTATEVEVGFLLGLLVGEGHFGGDGRQPQVTLRMHVRHEGTFRRLQRRFPGARLYGPYTHGGRSYFQWMARGPYLRDVLAPLIARHRDLLDGYAAERFLAMCDRYRIALTPPAPPVPPPHGRRSGAEEEDGRVVGDVGGDRGAQPPPPPEHPEEQPQQQDVEVGGGGQAVAGVLEVEAGPED